MSSWSPPPVVSRPEQRKRTRLVVLICLAGMALVVVLLNLGKGTYQSYRLASSAVERFHRQLDSDDYNGIYTEASGAFRKWGTHDDCLKFLRMVHQKMGNSGKTSFAGFHVNWTNGSMWIDQVLNTRFALGQGQEHFVWVVDQNQLRLYKYQIDSPNLH